jgi:thioredoxin reductase
MFDVLIIGAGVSGVSCAFGIGFCSKQSLLQSDKKIGIIAHQKASSLQNAIFNNAYGIPAGKLGSELLAESLAHFNATYPHVQQIEGEKVLSISGEAGNFCITTNKNIRIKLKLVVIALVREILLRLKAWKIFVDSTSKNKSCELKTEFNSKTTII